MVIGPAWLGSLLKPSKRQRGGDPVAGHAGAARCQPVQRPADSAGIPFICFDLAGRREPGRLRGPGRRQGRPAQLPLDRRLRQARACRATWCRAPTAPTSTASLGLPVPLRRRHPARHPEQGHDAGDAPPAPTARSFCAHVAERHRQQSAQSDVRHCDGRRAIGGKLLTLIGTQSLGIGRQLAGAAGHDQSGAAADHDHQPAGRGRPGQHRRRAPPIRSRSRCSNRRRASAAARRRSQAPAIPTAFTGVLSAPTVAIPVSRSRRPRPHDAALKNQVRCAYVKSANTAVDVRRSVLARSRPRIRHHRRRHADLHRRRTSRTATSRRPPRS